VVVDKHRPQVAPLAGAEWRAMFIDSAGDFGWSWQA